MSLRRLLLHAGADLLVIGAALGIPVLLSPQGRAVVSGADAVSSATVAVDAPSGEFVVLLNLDALTEDDFWQRFFAQEEVDFCFEDITCLAARSDPAAVEMAQSYASHLSEHQMTIRQEDMTLILSRADAGKFQVIVISKELAEHYQAQTANAVFIQNTGETS